jgi:hypothetical protein
VNLRFSVGFCSILECKNNDLWAGEPLVQWSLQGKKALWHCAPVALSAYGGAPTALLRF